MSSGVAEPGHSTLVLSSLCDGLSLSGQLYRLVINGQDKRYFLATHLTPWQKLLACWGGAGNSDSCPVDGCQTQY